MCSTGRYKGSAKSGGIFNWFIQRWTGVVLVILLLTHFYISHFTGAHQITYSSVMERLSNPAWKTFDLVFLYFATYHGVMGAWNVVSDYKICKMCKVFIYSLFLALIAYLVVFGTVTIVSIQPVGG